MSADGEQILYASPLGSIELLIASRLKRVRLLRDIPDRGEESASGAGSRFVRALDRYFAGGSPGISLSEVDLSGRTQFQRDVYRALMRVPRGELTGYGELARAAGRPGAARAVGQALGRNPVPIFVPCHRVVRASGELGGFSGGLHWKTGLLRMEGHRIEDGLVESDASADTATVERTAEGD